MEKSGKYILIHTYYTILIQIHTKSGNTYLLSSLRENHMHITAKSENLGHKVTETLKLSFIFNVHTRKLKENKWMVVNNR